MGNANDGTLTTNNLAHMAGLFMEKLLDNSGQPFMVFFTVTNRVMLKNVCLSITIG
jgi:hypothetical protein